MALELRSVSLAWRLKGNKVYQSVTNWTAPTLREFRLLEAIKDYYRAYNTAENDNELSSAAKNYAMASWKLALTCAEGQKPDLALHYFKESIDYFLSATKAGQKAQPVDWQRKLEESMRSCVDQFLSSTVANFNGECRGEVIAKVIDYLPEGATSDARASLELARSYFGQSVTQLERGDYKKALSSLKEAYAPVERVKRLAESRDSLYTLRRDADVLSTDITFQMCVAESMQARAIG